MFAEDEASFEEKNRFQLHDKDLSSPASKSSDNICDFSTFRTSMVTVNSEDEGKLLKIISYKSIELRE